MIVFLPFISGIAAYHLFIYFPASTIIILTVSVLSLVYKRRFAAALIIALGFAFAWARYDSPEDGINRQWLTEGEHKVSAYFITPAVYNQVGARQMLCPINSDKDCVDVFGAQEYEIGRVYELTLSVRNAVRRDNPGDRPSRTQTITVVDSLPKAGRADSIIIGINRVRQNLNSQIRAEFPPDEAALLMAITTGESGGGMDATLRSAYNQSGVGHILSISGSHFALLALVVFGAVRAIVRLLPMKVLEKITLYVTPSEAAAIATAPVMVSYLGLSGAGAPAIRAFITISLFLLGLLIGRSGQWLNTIMLAAALILAIDPSALLSLSFQMSFIAVIFIGAIAGRYSDWRPFYHKRPDLHDELSKPDASDKTWHATLSRAIYNSVLVSLAATMGVAPVIAYHMHGVSIISPLSNLIITPVIGFVLLPIALIGAFSYLLTGSYLVAGIAGPMAAICNKMTIIAASIQFSSISIGRFPIILIALFYIGAAVFFISKKPRWLLLSVLPAVIYFIVIAIMPRGLSVTFLDAGRADASVIELPDKKTILIDTGRNGFEAMNYFRFLGIKDIDALAVTHSHADHAGGVRKILKRFRVREIWDNGRLEYKEGIIPQGVIIRHLQRGDIIRSAKGGYSIEAMHPYDGFHTANSDSRDTSINNDSLVLRISDARGNAALFTGDIEAEAAEDIISIGDKLKSAVLKVPHHGLGSSFNAEMVNAVKPDIIIISSHPDMTKKLYESYGIGKVVYTGQDGAVKVEFNNSGYKIKKWSEFKMRPARGIRDEMHNIKTLFVTW